MNTLVFFTTSYFHFFLYGGTHLAYKCTYLLHTNLGNKFGGLILRPTILKLQKVYKGNSINVAHIKEMISKIVRISAKVEDHQRAVTDYWSKSTIKIVCTEPILTSNPLEIPRTVKIWSHRIISRTWSICSLWLVNDPPFRSSLSTEICTDFWND